ncbi:glycine zipper domain-containing protein [Niallia oryzisoli]|uniref:Glycine zipper domain-containing protein n=1 Tax=Niallia oryzisoli TaxID=1737571 RepID=A0ABZ2CJ74_9BACI
MDQGNERKNFDGNAEESSNNQAGSIAIQDATNYGETTGTFNGAVTGAMIGAPFGVIGAVIGGVSGATIGNQMGEGAEVDDHTASENRDVSNNINSINK